MRLGRPEETGRTTVKVVEAWAAYKPPVNVRRAIERLLDQTPPRFTAGLDRVVLRDAAVLSASEKRKRKSRKGKVLLGTYYRATPSSEAYRSIRRQDLRTRVRLDAEGPRIAGPSAFQGALS